MTRKLGLSCFLRSVLVDSSFPLGMRMMDAAKITNLPEKSGAQIVQSLEKGGYLDGVGLFL